MYSIYHLPINIAIQQIVTLLYIIWNNSISTIYSLNCIICNAALQQYNIVECASNKFEL